MYMYCNQVCRGDSHIPTHTQYTHNSQAKVPYKLIRQEHVIGLPPGITLNHPTMLSQDKLEAIYNNLSSIKFVREC